MSYLPRNLAELGASVFCLVIITLFAYQYLNLLP
ncbi:hypothetical protein C8D90_101491 [Enterobacillus tribolii]|uniref:Uncharacterized protein n=1 Tax=Enterobacillus tribolii TaxID=1487935 RepID=A0A370R3N4_9GAMM|nr:hypothetical protein C8D90_101491 [Enterobacillus tribolii]